MTAGSHITEYDRHGLSGSQILSSASQCGQFLVLCGDKSFDEKPFHYHFCPWTHLQ
jgi:hypothetical protein